MRWKIVPSPSPKHYATLRSVSAVSTDSAWAVGDQDTPIHPLIEHWNGHRWRVQTFPDIGPGKSELAGVSMTSSRDRMGGRVPDDRLDDPDLGRAWNGHQWTVVPSPRYPTQSYLSGVVTISAERAWAVGSYYDTTARPLALHCC